MMHKAWRSTEEVPYCFSRSYIKFQGHTALKIVEFDPNWAFPDSNSSLNSPMAMKCCTKLETIKERCPIVFQGHPSNFKVTRDKTSPILTQIGHFWTIGRSQLSNLSDLPCFFYIYHLGQDLAWDCISASYLIKYAHTGRSCDLLIFGIPEVNFLVRAFQFGMKGVLSRIYDISPGFCWIPIFVFFLNFLRVS